MLEKFLKDNPVSVLLLCCSIIGTGYVMNYRLDSIDQGMDKFKDEIKQEIKDLSDDLEKWKIEVAKLQGASNASD